MNPLAGEGMSATPIDIAVRWAVDVSDAATWRTSGVDRFFRWSTKSGRWCQHWSLPPEIVVPVERVVVFCGRLFAFHPDGVALVMETTRMLAVLPVGALRVEEGSAL